MDQNLHVKLITQYILDSGYKSFEDVEAFAAEIGASFEDLETAIYDVAREHPHIFGPQTEKILQEQNVSKKRKMLQMAFRFKHMGLVVAAVFLSTVISLQFVHQSLSQRTTSTTNAQTLLSEVDQLEIPHVYANQQPVNADKVFSYPAIPVTLQYKNKPEKEVFGFFPYWMISQYDKINIQGYSTVAIFGLETDAKGNIITSHNGSQDLGWQLWTDPRLDLFISRLKKQNIKVVITIKAFNRANIEKLTQSDAAQQQFISNAVQLMNSKDLDGINIDFEYIGVADDKVKHGFNRLIANLNTTLKDSYPDAQLTVDTFISAGIHDTFFQISELANHVDALVIMGYDIHTVKGAAGPVAPLEGPGGLVGYMESYLRRVNPEKLILALPYYGYHWPASQGGVGGTLAYAEIAELQKTNKVSWSPVSQTPSLSFTDGDGSVRVLHFDNTRSMGLKYDYINAKNLKGVGIWAMGYDGFNSDLEKVLFEKFGPDNF